MEEYIICVDNEDKEIGTIEKMAAHEKGVLHRALSVFILNDKNELLIQKRYSGKYHSPGLWTNTCCTHPNSGETVYNAANRRLLEEMGFSCSLKEVFSFIYKAEFDNGLIEHEYDHVFVGRYSGTIKMNPEEVEDYKWINIDDIISDIKENPQDYTFWFKDILKNFYSQLIKGIKLL